MKETTMLTVKDYAQLRNKSIQSVYKQMKAKTNAEKLEGHIHELTLGNKQAKFLDEEAIKILDEASKQTPSVAIIDCKDERIEELEKELEELRTKYEESQNKLIQAQSMIISNNEKLLEMSEKMLALTQKPEPKKKFWEFWKE